VANNSGEPPLAEQEQKQQDPTEDNELTADDDKNKVTDNKSPSSTAQNTQGEVLKGSTSTSKDDLKLKAMQNLKVLQSTGDSEGTLMKMTGYDGHNDFFVGKPLPKAAASKASNTVYMCAKKDGVEVSLGEIFKYDGGNNMLCVMGYTIYSPPGIEGDSPQVFVHWQRFNSDPPPKTPPYMEERIDIHDAWEQLKTMTLIGRYMNNDIFGDKFKKKVNYFLDKYLIYPDTIII
jgi:hypothetical protein